MHAFLQSPRSILERTRIKKDGRNRDINRIVHLVSLLATLPFTSFSAACFPLSLGSINVNLGSTFHSTHKVFNSNRITNSRLNGIAKEYYILDGAR